MNRFLVISLVLLSFSTSAQSVLGGLKITAFSNKDNKLKNNVEVASIELLVVHIKTKDTISNGRKELPANFQLRPGKYRMIAHIEGYSEIESVCTISADRITFIDFLFEPKQKKRKRYVTGA